MLSFLTVSSTSQAKWPEWKIGAVSTRPALPALNGFSEHWLSEATASKRGAWQFFSQNLHGGWLMAVVEMNFGDAEAASYKAYQQLLTAPELQGYRLARLWNFVPSINSGDGDDEIYRQFCLGRYRAFNEQKVAQYPSATAVGAAGEKLQIYVLATKLEVDHIENPRQVPAWQYPRQYGPASPSFARATNVAAENLLFISGTAAVVGHESKHQLDVEAQTDLSLDNMAQLLPVGAKAVFIKAYIRNANDAPEVESRLRLAYPQAALSLLRADICRRDLLVEIEAIFNN